MLNPKRRKMLILMSDHEPSAQSVAYLRQRYRKEVVALAGRSHRLRNGVHQSTLGHQSTRPLVCSKISDPGSRSEIAPEDGHAGNTKAQFGLFFLRLHEARQRRPRLIDSLPVHVCTERFAQAHARLNGRGLLDAVEFVLEFNRGNVEASAMPQLIADFAASRQAMGVHAD